MPDPDLSPAHYPAEPAPVDLDALPCRCSRHDLTAAGRMATAMNAGFGMRLPNHVTTCTEPGRANDPEVQKFWREVDL